MFLKNTEIKKNHNLYFSKRKFIAAQVYGAVVLLLFLSSLVLTGCTKIIDIKNDILGRFGSEKNSEEAVAAVREFFDFIIVKDYDSAYRLVYPPPGSVKNLEDFKKEFNSVTEIVSIEINWVEVKNNVAIVGIDMIDTYDGEEKIYKDTQISLVKDEKESWKINFWEQQIYIMN